MVSQTGILCLLAAALAASSPIPESQAAALTGTKYLFSFGDSYSQTGFEISSTKASASNPLGNPAFPGYTTDNGINWVGHLVHTYNTSLTLSYNFAYGGATVDASLVAPYESTVLSLVDQTSEFSNNVASKPSYAPWTSENSLFAIWLGVNDVGNSYGSSGQAALQTKILNQYIAQAQIMYNAGGRNFAFLTVPPINKTPLMLAESSSAQSLEATVIASFNNQLASLASTFQSQNSGSKVTIVDTQTPFNNALNNPTSYGASSNGATCYNSDGVSCLWWNNYHPGQAIQKLVGAAVASAFSGTFF